MGTLDLQPAPDLTSESRDARRLENRQRRFELGLVVLIAIIPSTLRATGTLFHPITGPMAAPGFWVASGFLHETSSLLLVAYFLSRRQESLRTLGLNWRWMDVLTGLGLALAAVFLEGYLHIVIRLSSVALTGHPPDMRDPRIIFAGISTGSMVLYSISSAFYEETVVRGYVTTRLISLACPVWLATVISIVLQTSYHVYYGLGGALSVSGVFIVFALYFAFSRRLLPVILGHLFVDLFATWVNTSR